MPYIAICQDRLDTDTATLRQQHLRDHLAYVETIMAKILVAGPVRDEQGNINTSCFIYDAETQPEALKLLHNDPYYLAGIYDQVDCRPFNPVAGDWVCGKAW